MLISDFLHALDRVVPLAAVGYDKDAVGLQVGFSASQELTRALFAYEVTLEVVEEARKKGANLIVAFHPLIFPSISRLTDETRTGQLLRALVKNEIALYILHTAFDTHPTLGTSRRMADALGLQQVRVLATHRSVPGFGMGMIGEWPKERSLDEVLSIVQGAFRPERKPKEQSLRYCRNGRASYSRAAMVGGSGMDFYAEAVRQGAEVFITADVRYHDFYRAEHDGVLLIDAGHSETERFVAEGMLEAAAEALRQIERSGPAGSEVTGKKGSDESSVKSQGKSSGAILSGPEVLTLHDRIRVTPLNDASHETLGGLTDVGPSTESGVAGEQKGDQMVNPSAISRDTLVSTDYQVSNDILVLSELKPNAVLYY